MPGHIDQGRTENPHHRRPPAAFVAAGDLHQQGLWELKLWLNLSSRWPVNIASVDYPLPREELTVSTAAKQACRPTMAQLFQEYVIPNYGRFPWRWCAAKARGSGTIRAIAISISSPVGAATCWAIVRRRGRGCATAGRPIDSRPQHVAHRAQGRWAKLLSERSFGGQAFFCNSGAEANEAAIKLARLHASDSRYKIITFEGGFHGRTYAAVTATAQPKYHEDIGPLLPDFSYAPFGDSGSGAQENRRRDRAPSWSNRSRAKAESGIPPRVPAGLRDWPTSTSCC